MANSLLLFVSNLPIEATEDDLRQLMTTVKVEDIAVTEGGSAVMRVSSIKDVREALTYDTKYLRYKEIQVRRAPADTIIPQKPVRQNLEYETVGALRMRGLPFKVTDEEIIDFFSGYQLIKNSIKYKLDEAGRKSGQVCVLFTTKSESLRA